MKVKQPFLLLASLLAAWPLAAQVNLSTLPHTQNFDLAGLTGSSGSWADNSTVPGWYAANHSGTPYSGWSATAGGGTSSSTFYTMGTSSSATDRAIGGAPSSVAWTVLGLRLVNDTGSVFNDLRVQYDLEQWSDRGTATITMSYQVFAPGSGSLGAMTGWTAFNTASSPLPINSTPVSGIGNTTGLLPGVTGGIDSIGLQAGDELWLRWEIKKIGGQNATHGIDNVLVQVPEPAAGGLLVLGLLVFAGSRTRRV